MLSLKIKKNKSRCLTYSFTWHFSADIRICNNPGGGGNPGWWNKGSGIALGGSRCDEGVPTEDGGGKVSPFRWWWGGTNKPGLKWNEPFESEGNLSGDGVIWDIDIDGEWWIWLEDDCCSFGFLGPLSCWTAEKICLMNFD